MTDLLFAPLLRAARNALFGPREPRRYAPPPARNWSFDHNTTGRFTGWPNLTRKDPWL